MNKKLPPRKENWGTFHLDVSVNISVFLDLGSDGELSDVGVLSV